MAQNQINETAPDQSARPGIFAIILPGFLVAATGVGAGDLATASFTGSQLGVGVLWAVLVGAVFKFVLTEGLARFQLASGATLLEGVAHRFGPVAGWLFLPYLLLWTFFVGAALMGACGVTLHAMLPMFDDSADAKIIFGIAASLIGFGLVRVGGFSLFSKLMAICIVFMFATVLATAYLLWPGTDIVLAGLFAPKLASLSGDGLTWTIALIGGIGGTLTMLCYGYWIREGGFRGAGQIPVMRVDLFIGYSMTALFGLAMVIIGSTIEIEGRGADLLVTLADRLEEPLGIWGRWAFLIGAFGAVFSSLLGVWQSVPYIFADLWRLFLRPNSSDISGEWTSAQLSRTSAYKFYQIAIATVPMIGLLYGFKDIQKYYAVIGALFVPLLAITLIILNNNHKLLRANVNGKLAVMMLLLTLGFFGYVAWLKLAS